MSETDSVSVQIDASAQAVFEFMADVEKLTLWSFGTWKIVSRDDGLIEGRALANDAQVLLRIDPDPGRMLIDYHLGDAPDALQQRYVRAFGRLADWEQAQLVSSLERVADMLDAKGMDAAPVLTTGELRVGRKAEL